MNLSPTSAASSDIYPSSEPPERETRAQNMLNLPIRRERLHPALEDRDADLGYLTHPQPSVTHSSQGLHMVGHGATHAQSNPSTDVVAMPNGDPQRDHKRKREDDETIVQEKPSVVRQRSIPHPGRAISHDSRRYISNEESGNISDDGLSKKRSKPNNEFQRPISRTGNPFQSPVLPAELWQHIFCFVPPVFLGRLLHVNHAFHVYLTSGKAKKQDSEPVAHSIIQPLSSQAIWAASRRRFCPGLPKPIRGISELDMWRLLRGHNCQICGETKASSLTLNPENPWESGPGEKGVRVIWPFAIRCCGNCVQERSEKEVNLHFSSDCPSFLLPALPFAFISSSNNYIANTVLRNIAPPSELQLTKHYYKPHIEEIKQRLEGARELGSASADEWIKGLDGEGKDRLSEAVRWEQWEVKGGLKKVNLRPVRATTRPVHTTTVSKASTAKNETHSDRSTPQGVRLQSRFSVDSGSPSSSSPIHLPYFQPNTSTSYQPPWVPVTSYSENPLHRNPISFPQLRPERNIRDVNEAKAARRAEIERRCVALDPPLPPNVLGHMETFQAAIQISQPLSEQAWQVLKPRLLTQRAYAERKEKDRVEQSQLLQAEYKQRRQQEAQLKETKESLDREWASIQTPIRNQIAEFADEIIETKWARGKSVTKDNSPKFAADVLLYVRRRFYDEVARGKEDDKSISEIIKTDNLDSAPSRILILENMKWLFDTKIKPLTEHFQKELFLCNGCDGNFKFYGLDSVVQHYAAKHTHDLSLGTQVVHWRAEWPENPPFHPHPSAAKAAYYKIPTPQTSSLQGLSMRDSPVPTNPEGYGQLTNPAPVQQSYNSSQYSPRAYPEPYSQIFLPDRNYSPPTTHNFMLPAPSAPGHAQDFQPSTKFGPVYLSPHRSTFNNMYTMNGFQPSHSGGISQAEHSAISGYVPTDPYAQDQKTLGWHAFDSFPRKHGGTSTAQHQPNHQTRPLNFQQSYTDQSRDVTGRNAELYQHQLDEMAKHARDVWFATSGIKDIPQSVRIFVVIQHMVARYKKMYAGEPSLAMFIEGLDHNSLMRPVRSLNGLACKVCVTNGSGANGESNPYAPLPTGDRRLYTLPHLLNHFRTAHLEPLHSLANPIAGIESPGLDWKLDMIELPEQSLIADLTEKPGLDDVKLELIARVFPGVFPSPLPRLGAPGNVGPVPVYTGGFDLGARQLSKIVPEVFPDSPLRGEVRNENQQFTRSYSSFRELSQPARSSEPPGEDEYDPHRPALPSGVSLVHLRKSARTPSTDNEQSSTLLNRHRDFHYVPSDAIDRPQSSHNVPPTRRAAGDHHSVQYYETSSNTRSRMSPRHRVEVLPEDHFNDEQGCPREQKTLEKLSGQGFIVDSSVKHTHISEDRELRDGSASLKQRQRSISVKEGTSAADQFLDNLASSSDLNPGQKIASQDREGTRSIARRDEISQERFRQQQIDGSAESQGWRVDVGSGQRHEADPAAVSMRKDSSKGRSYDELSSPHGRPNDQQYDENYRSSSQIQRAPSENKVNRRSPETYTAYEAPHQTIIQDRYETRGGLIEGSHIRDGSFHIAPTPRYRSRSRSPRPIPLGTTYYRARSPADDHRHESVYHIRSPPLRKDVHSQRIISYDYPLQDRYEYVNDRKIAHNQLRPRVEYVPVRLHESAPIEPSRFVIAQPAEMRPQPDYVRFDRGYPGEPIYERHGQIYHADPGSYHPQQGHGAPTFSQGYRY